MNREKSHRINNLTGIARFVLFATSYIPLFILISFKQISENVTFLIWGGLNIEAISLCLQKFGISIFVISLSVIGIIGCRWTLQNLKEVSKNGNNVTVLNINNKNSESVGYIATYKAYGTFAGKQL